MVLPLLLLRRRRRRMMLMMMMRTLTARGMLAWLQPGVGRHLARRQGPDPEAPEQGPPQAAHRGAGRWGGGALVAPWETLGRQIMAGRYHYTRAAPAVA
jgi:hypothetical protein